MSTDTGGRPPKPSGPGPGRWAADAVQHVTATALGPYQSAVVRIGFSATWMLFLLREIPHRRELYGPDGPWSWEMARQLITRNGAFTGLMWSDSTVWFETVYAVAIVSSALLLLGWRTRTMSVLFMFGVLSLQNRSVFMGDGGDNVIHLMAVYLVLTRCGQVWSLDARRAARAASRAPGDAPDAPACLPGPVTWGVADVVKDTGTSSGPGAAVAAGAGRDGVARDRVGPVLWAVMGVLLLVGSVTGGVRTEIWMDVLLWGMWVIQALWWAAGRYGGRAAEPRALLDVFANLIHNAGLLVIMSEVCLVYATAGWYKIQGSRWQDGTALFYPLKLNYFSPWPGLSAVLAASSVMVLLLTYGTVIVQVAFPFTVFNRRVKNVLLVAMMLEHTGIAVLLGLPFFSLAMISADAVFLPTNFLRWLGGRIEDRRGRLRPRAGTLPEQRTDSSGQPRTLVG